MTSLERGTLLDRLHDGLRQRPTPQQVARDLIALGAAAWLPDAMAARLHELARTSLGWSPIGSSMATTWRRHPGLSRAYTAAQTAVTAVAYAAGRPIPASADSAVPEQLLRWLDAALELLGLPAGEPSLPHRRRRPRVRTYDSYGYTYTIRRSPAGRRGEHGGHADARDRMDAATRRVQLPGVSVRAYRRAVGAVLHLQQRTAVLREEREREFAIRFGKSRLAATISRDEFGVCTRTAAFVAYYTARLGMRTVFTNTAQARPMDELAQALLDAALDAPTCRPDVISRVLTRPAIVLRLSEQQRGALLGEYYAALSRIARMLRSLFDVNRDRLNMVVRQGDDSGTWNAATRAFNQARTGWLNLATVCGLDAAVEARCPGKVPALIAADVAAWHLPGVFDDGGTGQHNDVAVWAQLPLPWDVVLGNAQCPAQLVRDACAQFNIDPDATGWTQPYRQSGIEKSAVAPDLVNGVVVSSPLLAGLLRDAGLISSYAPSDRQERLQSGLLLSVLDQLPEHE